MHAVVLCVVRPPLLTTAVSGNRREQNHLVLPLMTSCGQRSMTSSSAPFGCLPNFLPWFAPHPNLTSDDPTQKPFLSCQVVLAYCGSETPNPPSKFPCFTKLTSIINSFEINKYLVILKFCEKFKSHLGLVAFSKDNKTTFPLTSMVIIMIISIAPYIAIWDLSLWNEIPGLFSGGRQVI